MQDTSSTEYQGHTTVSIYLAYVCAGWTIPVVCLHICRLLGVSRSRWLGGLYFLCCSVDLICSWVSLPPQGTSELVRATSSHRRTAHGSPLTTSVETGSSSSQPHSVSQSESQGQAQRLGHSVREKNWKVTGQRTLIKGGSHFWTDSVTYNIIFFYNCYFFGGAHVL